MQIITRYLKILILSLTVGEVEGEFVGETVGGGVGANVCINDILPPPSKFISIIN